MHDAVIVLANLMDRDGNLNDETLARLEHACGLLEADAAPLLVPCGWAYRDDSDLCIADAMARDAVIRFGVDPARIVPERTSRDTVGDAVFTRRNLALPRGWESVLVVTSAYHAERTREIFSFVYGRPVEVSPAPSDDTEALREAEARSLAAFRRTFEGVTPGDEAAIYERLIARHPFYEVAPPLL